MKIGLLGFGTVGQGVYELAKTRPDICVSRVLCRRELDLADAVVTHDYNDILQDDSIDTVVEVMGGLHPAYEYVRAALEKGKRVITANKALMAAYYADLIGLAENKGVSLRCTAAVGGGIGWLTALERAGRMEKVTRLWGIMNGTCNYILDAMASRGLDYGDVLKKAQELGYAEADPSADVDGIDTHNKLILSANIAFGADLDRRCVPAAGIRNICVDDVAAFAAHGMVCKLIGYADSANAFVQPTLFPVSKPEGTVPKNYNLISFESPALGRQSFFGQGAGRYPTAMNVLQDCVDTLEGKRFYCGCGEKTAVSNEKQMQFYVRGAALPAELTAENWGCGIVTKPIAVGKFHEMMKDCDGVFFAALEGGE